MRFLISGVSSMSREDHHQEGYQQLLHSLKGTVEGLLISQVSNVWNIYGGLNRLHNAMEKIFKHGCRVFNHDVRFYIIGFFCEKRHFKA